MRVAPVQPSKSWLQRFGKQDNGRERNNEKKQTLRVRPIEPQRCESFRSNFPNLGFKDLANKITGEKETINLKERKRHPSKGRGKTNSSAGGQKRTSWLAWDKTTTITVKPSSAWTDAPQIIALFLVKHNEHYASKGEGNTKRSLPVRMHGLSSDGVARVGIEYCPCNRISRAYSAICDYLTLRLSVFMQVPLHSISSTNFY
jgi:hypothetical protein